ncbi:hypothetical protein BDV06DRAFT_214096 [Aspergillus oleicola]
MDSTLPDDEAITVPVPIVELVVKDRFRTFNNVVDILALSDKKFDLIIQHCSDDLHYALLDDELVLEWLNAVRVHNMEFIPFTNVQKKPVLDSERQVDVRGIQVIEVGFPEPVPGDKLKAFWKRLGN